MGSQIHPFGNVPVTNPFLSAEKYGTAHFDSAQTDAIPFPAPRGSYQVHLNKAPRVPGGPIGLMQLASTSPHYMWGTSSGGVSYIDVSNGGFHIAAQAATPGAHYVPHEALDEVLRQSFSDVSQIERAIHQDLGIDWTRVSTNGYCFVDKDNVLYATGPGGKIHAYALSNPLNPIAGIQVLRTLDLSESLMSLARDQGAFLEQHGLFILGCQLTYDGKLCILTNRSLMITERTFDSEIETLLFDPREFITNSMAIDEDGGIYVASDTTMHKIVWTGSRLSTDESDGAWTSPYDYGREPPSVKFGRGTGSTPTLMGFGDDPDKLVVITDGSDQMKIVAFWRNDIPEEFIQQPGTKSRRIAGQFEITCGLFPKPEFIQSEQSVVVKDYGAFVVNNIRANGAQDRLIDVIAGGPVFDSPHGVERVEWDPESRTWLSVWTRNDVVSTSMVPCVSSLSNIVFVNGYTNQDGWELTGMDWDTGKTVHRSIFGHDNLGNGAYALIQFLPNGDLLFNSIGGAIRVHFDAPVAIAV